MTDSNLQVVIEINSGPSTGQSVTVPLERPFVIGRLAECDMTIENDPAISREHCQITVTAAGIQLTNSSSNGTRVNGQAVDACNLQDGDQLVMGDSTVLLVHIQAADAPPADPPQSGNPVDPESPAVTPAGPAERAFSPDEATGSLEVIHGPAAGTVIAVATGQPVLIGSQADCNLVIEGDRSISREHCKIELVPPDCHLHDLSTHGTLVNHLRVDTLTGLFDGDEIEIGHNTIIRVALDSVVAASTGNPGAPVFQSGCENGLVKIHPADGNQAGIWTMAQRLTGLSPLHAVVDFHRGEADMPEAINAPEYLLDWHPPETIADHSPVLLSPDGRDQMQSALDAVAGKDAALLIFSSLPTADLHGNLRALSTVNPSTGKPSRPSSLFAFWWPSLLNQMLQHSLPDMVDQIMAGNDAMLIETDDEGEWCLFGTEEFAKQVERLGLVTIQETPAPEDGE